MTAQKKLTGPVYQLQASPAHQGMRLDVFLAAALAPKVSRSRLQQLIKAGGVYLNNHRIDKASLRLTGDESIMVKLWPPLPSKPLPQALPLVVVYEDQHLMVLEKPAGQVVHPAPGHLKGTIVNALLAYCGPKLAAVGNPQRPGIVHRLDKDTSGLMVVAKTEFTHQQLTAAFKQRTVHRSYLCLVQGQLKPDYSVVDAPIGRHPKVRFKMAVVPDGRPARTELRVLRRLKGYTYLKAILDSGRTHQIRVHLAFIGHPVLGDNLYGRRHMELNLKRQFLHAAWLSFVHPVTKNKLEFESPLPQDLKKALSKLESAGK